MNILFCSVPFRPSVGGIETVSALLADSFQRLGHRVRLVTQTDSGVPDTDAFEVVRRPSMWRLLALVRWADVVFHNNISLRLAWPQLLLRRPWVVAHHTWIPTTGLAARLKRGVLPLASHIAVSRAMADSLGLPSRVVPNPYFDDLFMRVEGCVRERELVFVGRLVSDKGADQLIEALRLLARRGTRYRLTLVGDGAEDAALRRQVAAAGLEAQVDFAGRQSGLALVAILNAHQVLVVPSVWEEPFGVVVLEAMACGCVPLVTRSGGLPDAVGVCGVVLPPCDRSMLPSALADAIERLVGDPAARDHYRQQSVAHLERHTRDRVARDYLQVISDAHCRHATQSTARLV